MATTTGLSILITAQNQASGAIDAVRKSLSGLADGARNTVNNGLEPIRNLLATGLKVAAAGAAGAIGGLLGLAGKSIALAAGFEQTEVAFSTMLGSADKAKQVMKDLFDFSAKTPFQFEEVAGAAKSLMAFGVSADDVKETLRRLGDVAAGIGAPVGDIAEIYGKAKVSGKLFAEDINQLTGRGIPIIQALAKVLGVTDGEVKKMVSDGKVGFPELQKAFQNMTDKGGQFSGMMAAQSQTLAGLWSSLKDNVELALAGIGKTLVDNLNLRDVLATATDWIGQFGAKIQALAATWIPFLVENIKALIYYIQAVAQDGDTMNDWLTHMAPGLQNIVLRVVDFITWLKNAVQPIADLIARFVTWKDVAIAAAGIVAAIVIPALAGMVAAFALAVAVVAGAIAIVATLRNAWEVNFGGIRTLVQALATYLQERFGLLFAVVRDYGGGALREILAWVNGTETQFRNLSFLWDVVKNTAQLFFSDVINYAKNNLPLWSAKLIAWGEAAWKWIADATSTALIKLSEWGAAIWAWITSNAPTWAIKLVAWGEAAWKWIADATPTALAKLSEWGAAIWAWITSNVPTWVTKLVAWGEAAWKWIADATPTALVKLSEWFASIVKWISDNTPTWLGKLTDWGKGIWQWIADATPTAIVKLGEWLGSLGTWFTQNLSKWVGNFLTWETAMWKWIADAAPQAIDKLTVWADDLIKWASSGGSGDSKILSMFGTLMATMLEALAKIGVALGKLALTVAADLLIALANGLLGWAGIDINLWAMKDHFVETFNTVTANLGNHFYAVAGDLVTSIANGITDGKSTASSAIGAALDSITSTFNTTKDTIKTKFSADAKTIIWAISDAFTLVKNDPVSAMTSILNSIGTALTPASQAGGIKGQLATYGKELVWSVRDGINLVKDDPSGAMNIAFGTISSAADTALAVGSQIYNHLKSKGTDVLNALWTGLSSEGNGGANAIKIGFQSVIDWVNSNFDAGGSIFNHLSTKGREIGIALMVGIAGGIREMIGSVADAVGGAAQSAVDRMKSVLGIASPSKVFAEMGTNIMEGLAQGIEALSSAPQAALQTATAGLTDLAAGGQGGSTTVNYNRTVQTSNTFNVGGGNVGGRDPFEAVRVLNALYGQA